MIHHNLWCETCGKREGNVGHTVGQEPRCCPDCSGKRVIIWDGGAPKWAFSRRHDKNPTGQGTPRHSNRSVTPNERQGGRKD